MLAKGKIILRQFLSIIALIVGIPSALFWGLGIFAAFDPEMEDTGVFVAVCLIFVAIAVAIIAAGICGMRFARLCKNYSYVLSTKSVTTVPQLAGVFGTNVDRTRSNLRKMISNHYLTGLYLDFSSDRIVYADQQQETKAPLIAVKCPCCGGTTMLPKGSTAKCAYCNSVVKNF